MASAKPGNEDSSHQDLGNDEKRREKEKLKGKFPRKTVCTADLFCDKCPHLSNGKEHDWHYLGSFKEVK